MKVCLLEGEGKRLVFSKGLVRAVHLHAPSLTLSFLDRPGTVQESPDMTGAYILHDLNVALQLCGVVPVGKHLLWPTPAPRRSRHAGRSSQSASSTSQTSAEAASSTPQAHRGRLFP